ncbi:hypothetical protein ACFVFS_16330 [Kitasatospora sp. NPDC057692]
MPEAAHYHFPVEIEVAHAPEVDHQAIADLVLERLTAQLEALDPAPRRD